MRKLLFALGGVVLLAAGWFATRARAGVPATTPLFYSGFLEDQNGPVNGDKSIVLRIWNDPNAGSQVCNPSPSGSTTVTAGRFRFALDAGCVTAIHNNTELWLELTVDSQTIPRTKIGAVPYALEAGGVDWANVKGVPGEWPGTVPWTRVTAPSPRPIYTNSANSSAYSSNAAYCGKTSSTYNGAGVGGYTGAKAKCQTACSSSTAHLCSPEEILRTVSTGRTVDNGYYNSGYYADGRTDCDGWMNGTSSKTSAIWFNSLPNGSLCDVEYPLLCCD